MDMQNKKKQPKEEEISKEDFETFLNDKIEEYFENKNVDAIVNDITQKNCDKYNLDMISFSINKSLEMKENENILISNFLVALLKNKVVLPAALISAYQKVLDELQDLIIDVPKADQFLIEMISSTYLAGLDLGFLNTVLPSWVNPGGKVSPAEFLASILKSISNKSSNASANEAFAKSKLKFNALLPKSTNLKDFLSKRGLEWLTISKN